MRLQNNWRGLTLLELLLASSIFTIVLGAIYLMYVTNQTTFTRGESKVELQQGARVAMEMMAMDIRMAGYDPSNAKAVLALNPVPLDCAANPPQGSGPSAVQIACAAFISIIADVTGDGVTDMVVYKRDGNQLTRGIASWSGAGWGPLAEGELAEGITALSFTYYDGSDAVTANPADIKRITIEIATSGTAGGTQETYPLTMDVRLRNPGS